MIATSCEESSRGRRSLIGCSISICSFQDRRSCLSFTKRNHHASRSEGLQRALDCSSHSTSQACGAITSTERVSSAMDPAESDTTRRSQPVLIPLEKLFAGRDDILVYTPKSSSAYVRSDGPF